MYVNLRIATYTDTRPVTSHLIYSWHIITKARYTRVFPAVCCSYIRWRPRAGTKTPTSVMSRTDWVCRKSRLFPVINSKTFFPHRLKTFVGVSVVEPFEWTYDTKHPPFVRLSMSTELILYKFSLYNTSDCVSKLAKTYEKLRICTNLIKRYK